MAQQDLLTQRFLAPVSTQLIQLFTTLRRQLDQTLRAKQPVKLSKPYPLGQCLEISQAMWQALKQVDQSALAEDEAQGYQAFVQFVKSGGELRQVWGDLRGQYFQNAFLLGSWYLDVANDTVDVSKPPVEILPFDQSGLTPIRDFFHFADVAQRYWSAVVLPNILIPKLAPYFPIIVLQPNAGPQLHGVFDYMIALTSRESFQPSAAALEQMNFPEEWFEALRPCSDFGQQRPTTMAEYQQQALNACQRARARGRQTDNVARDSAVREALQVNQQWQSIRIQFS